MLAKYEVESIIKNALEDLDGLLSLPDYITGKSTVFDAQVQDAQDGGMYFYFNEDYTDSTTQQKFKILVLEET